MDEMPYYWTEWQAYQDAGQALKESMQELRDGLPVLDEVHQAIANRNAAWQAFETRFKAGK